MKRLFPLIIMVMMISVSINVHASGVGEFLGNFIPDSITKSLESMRIFFYDFMSFILDIFAIALFILWIVIIIGILYSIIYVIQLPKKLGAKNFHDAIVSLSLRLWQFMR